MRLKEKGRDIRMVLMLILLCMGRPDDSRGPEEGSCDGRLKFVPDGHPSSHESFI